MVDEKNRRKLKNYLFVNKAQIGIFISNLLLIIAVIGLIIVFILAPFYGKMFVTEDIYQQNLLSKQFIFLLGRCAWVFFIIVILLLVQQVVIIHRICGPFVPFKRILDKLCAGDLSSRIHLRRYDFFRREADQINEFMDQLSHILVKVKNCQQSVTKAIDTCPSHEIPEQAFDILIKIEHQVRVSQEELKKIKVGA